MFQGCCPPNILANSCYSFISHQSFYRVHPIKLKLDLKFVHDVEQRGCSPPNINRVMSFLAHLIIVITCRQSSFTPLNDFSSETPGPIFSKLHVEPSVKGGVKIYTNGHGPLIKMATMSIYQGWAANSTPGIYQWHLPVFTGLENTPQVANTGKYRQIEIFLALKNCRSL